MHGLTELLKLEPALELEPRRRSGAPEGEEHTEDFERVMVKAMPAYYTAMKSAPVLVSW